MKMQLWVEFVDLYHFRKWEHQSSPEQGIAGSMLAHPLRRGGRRNGAPSSQVQ